MLRNIINFKIILAAINIFLLLVIYYEITSKEIIILSKNALFEISQKRSSSNNIKFDQNSSKDMKLLDQKYFSERLARKRALSKSDVKTNFLNCITDEYANETNRTVGNLFRKQLYACIDLHVPFEKYEFESYKAINVEHKYFLPMDKDYYNNPKNNCFWLTAGVGRHTSVEKEFLKLYPRCKVFGVDLIPDNQGDFATFGKFIAAGISSDGQSKVIKSYTDFSGFTRNNLKLKPFEQILTSDVGTNLLHYLTIDIDGPEFEMLKEFEDFGRFHSYNGIVACQIDVELHTIKSTLPNFEYAPYMLHFFHKASSYLPVFASPYNPGHPWADKMTLINIKDTVKIFPEINDKLYFYH